MDNLHESGASIHRRRRRRRAAITLSLVGLMMLGTFAYAAAYFSGLVGDRVPKPVASAPCQPVTTPVKAALTPRTVTLNVYNATIRERLAASVAKSLRAQGFKVALVANDPQGRAITGVGEIRYGEKGKASATLAALRLSGAKMVRDKRTDLTVDFVLGNAFKALSTLPQVAASAKPAANPAQGVSAVKAAKPTPSPSRSC